MSQITRLAQILGGQAADQDLTTAELVLNAVRLGGLAGTLLNNTTLASVISNSHAPMSDNQNIVAGNGLTGGGSTASVPLAVAAADASITSTGSGVAVQRSATGAVGLAVDGIALNVDNSTLELNSNNARVKDLGITTGKLADNAVTGAKLQSDAAVDANRAVSTNHIKDTAVTNAKIAAGVDATKIADGTINNTQFETLGGITSNIQTQLNGKAPTTRLISTAAPLTGGGDLSGDRTLSIPKATTTIDGYLAATDWNTFNNKQQAITVAPIAGTSNANGATLSGGNLALTPADSTNGGVLTNGAQSIAGAKTFLQDLTFGANLTYLPTNDSTTTGVNANLAHSTSFVRLSNASLTSIATLDQGSDGHQVVIHNATGSPITIINNFGSPPLGKDPIITGTGANEILPNGGSIIVVHNATNSIWSISGRAAPLATATNNGLLSSTDWNTFNSKQAAGSYITALTGDVSASGPGSAAATVNSVGGSSATNIHSAEQAANAATASNTPSTIVKRDTSGNFSAGTITASLNGNATTSTSFTGSLVGDVTGTQGATVVSTVGGSSAANVHSAELAANAATTSNTPSTIVKRDSSGNFAAGTVTATHDGTHVKTLVAGETFAANTSFLVRWAVNGETAGRVYKADSTSAATNGKFYAFGVAQSAAGATAGQNIVVTVLGTLTLGSGDTNFGATDIGKAVYLTTAGGFSVTATSTSGAAVWRIGNVEDVNMIWVDMKQLNGINP